MNKAGQKLIELSVVGNPKQFGLTIILKNIFLQLGVNPLDVVEYTQDSTSGVAVFLSSAIKAKTLQQRIKALKLKSVATHLTWLKKPDWQEKWKRDFHPFALTKRLDVVPAWRKKDYRRKKNRRPILIDTVSAFGTGLHDTTRFMSVLIEEKAGRFQSFLDIGTGTGILSIVARKCGAKNVQAIDYDPECLPVALANMKINHLAFDRLQTCDVAKFKPAQTFDYVAANLISQDLRKYKRKLFSLISPEKYLAISGISVKNFPSVQKEFCTLRLKCLKILKTKHWAAVLYQRKRK